MKSKKINKNELTTKILGLILFWVGAAILMVGFFMHVNIIAILVGIGIIIVGLLVMRSPEAWEEWLMTWFGF